MFKLIPLMLILGLLAGAARAEVNESAHPVLTFVKKLEGFKATPYKDAKGRSIGYGHFINPGESFLHVTQGEASNLLYGDIQKAWKVIDELVTVDLNENQAIALSSLVYNIGGDAFKHSTLLRKLNAGDKIGAQKQFVLWCHSGGKVLPGLLARRKIEAAKFGS